METNYNINGTPRPYVLNKRLLLQIMVNNYKKVYLQIE